MSVERSRDASSSGTPAATAAPVANRMRFSRSCRDVLVFTGISCEPVNIQMSSPMVAKRLGESPPCQNFAISAIVLSWKPARIRNSRFMRKRHRSLMCMKDVKHTSAGMSCRSSASTLSCGKSCSLARASLTDPMGIWPVGLRSLSKALRAPRISCSRMNLINLKNSWRSIEPFLLKSTRLIRELTSSTLVVFPRCRSSSST
mmetsp:Transcript_113762/g.309081  ORF Transcript_113762/g.309081 Transcript_113762/m.309081 type:complete len:202 (-) Transcript_113762:33-638(-)